MFLSLSLSLSVKCQSPQISAKHPQQLRGRMPKPWLARFPIRE